MKKSNHEKYMHEVLCLAFLRKGKVSPNPYVASILVSNDMIVSRGVHKGAGNHHAEIEALTQLPKCFDRSKITLYVNLEPCCHYNKRTPPCAQFLIKEGIKKVVVGSYDPNPYVSGKGIALLRKNNVEVIEGILSDECVALNKIFYKNMTYGTPYIHGKIACSLDGKISLMSGESKWITSQQSRYKCHEERHLYDAILVGKNTFLNDLPSLNTRFGDKVIKENRKILVGNYKSILNKIDKSQRELYVIISFDSEVDGVTKKNINGVTVILFSTSLKDLLPILYKMEICSIYVEGGSKVFSYFLKHKLFDEISIFKAPKIIGHGKSFAEDFKIDQLSNSMILKDTTYENVGNDLLIKGRI